MPPVRSIQVRVKEVRTNPAFERAVEDAIVYALEKTASEAVIQAKRRPRMPVRTGTLQSSIQHRGAHRLSKGRFGILWGSFDVRYALYQEMGFRTRSGKFYPGRRFLRGAAEETYPRFYDYLRSRL